MQIARAGRSQVGNRSPVPIRPRAGRAPWPAGSAEQCALGTGTAARTRMSPRGPPSMLPRPRQRWGPGLGGGAGHSPCRPRPREPPPRGRSWRVKMRALIVTKRRRPPACPLPAAVRAALAAVRPPPWPHLQPGRGEAELVGPPSPAPPPKPGRSCPRLCVPFVPRRDRCAALIRRVTDGGGDRRFHLLTSNVGAGEGEAGARPWPARWLTR